jgi:hypothetical protein
MRMHSKRYVEVFNEELKRRLEGLVKERVEDDQEGS